MSRELFAPCPFCFHRELDSPDEVVVDLYLLDTFLSVHMDWLIDKHFLYELLNLVCQIHITVIFEEALNHILFISFNFDDRSDDDLLRQSLRSQHLL